MDARARALFAEFGRPQILRWLAEHEEEERAARASGTRLTAEDWADEVGVSRPSAHRWRDKAGLHGDLTRAEWMAITPEKYRR